MLLRALDQPKKLTSKRSCPKKAPIHLFSPPRRTLWSVPAKMQPTAPQVNSPGPDAGAYWLERRQSYRVKMTDSTISHQSDQHHQPNPTKARGNIKKGASKSRLTTRERTRTSSTGRKANHQGEGTQSSPADTSRMRMRKGPKATRGVGDPGSGPGRRNNCSGGDCRRGPSGGVGRGVGNSLRRETHAGTIVENG